MTYAFPLEQRFAEDPSTEANRLHQHLKDEGNLVHRRLSAGLSPDQYRQQEHLQAALLAANHVVTALQKEATAQTYQPVHWTQFSMI